MKKYRKKPLVIEAVQWDGEKLDGMYPIAFFKQYDQGWHYKGHNVVIHTLEGEMLADKGDYIIRGIKGEMYPVKADLFLLLYDEIKDDKS